MTNLSYCGKPVVIVDLKVYKAGSMSPSTITKVTVKFEDDSTKEIPLDMICIGSEL
jgi:hypothetical protein